MGLAITRRKDASQTRGLSKDGSGAKPCRQEVFYWTYDKQKDRYDFAQKEMEWWNEVERTNLIDNGSNQTFFRNIFLFLGLFSGTFYDFFFFFFVFC